ncbi:MAG: alpha/beta fold hydrolase, partial [Pseudomonadota bacterium]
MSVDTDVSAMQDLWSKTIGHMIEQGIQAIKTQEALAALKDEDVTIADTPADVVFQTDKVTLSRYRPLTKVRTDLPPVVICYGIFGRQTMIDLQQDRSLVQNLLRSGLDLYVVDWGNPTRADKYTTLDDLILGYLKDCIEYVVEEHGQPITMFG